MLTDQQLDSVVNAVTQNEVVFVMSETGSGKSTMIPKSILQSDSRETQQIYVTQPRVLAAESIVKYLMHSYPSLNVDYRHGKETRAIDERQSTRLIYATEGYLIRKLASNRTPFSGISHIILDEAHEQKKEMELILALWLREREQSNNVIPKLVIMTATFNPAKMSDFLSKFGVNNIETLNFRNRALVELDRYRIEYKPSEKNGQDKTRQPDHHDYFENCFKQTTDQFYQLGKLRSRPKPNILVFMPTVKDLVDMQEKLTSKLAPHKNIVILHSSCSQTVKEIVTNKDLCNHIVLCTNVAETSITIPRVQVVIDCCIQNVKIEKGGISMLVKMPATKNAMQQRAGRCNREQTFDQGVCIRLIDQLEYNDRPEADTPEILRIGHADTVLLMASGNIDSKYILSFNSEPIGIKCAVRACAELQTMGLMMNASDGTQRSSLSYDLSATLSELGIWVQPLFRVPYEVRCAIIYAVFATRHKSRPNSDKILDMIERLCCLVTLTQISSQQRMFLSKTRNVLHLEQESSMYDLSKKLKKYFKCVNSANLCDDHMLECHTVHLETLQVVEQLQEELPNFEESIMCNNAQQIKDNIRVLKQHCISSPYWTECELNFCFCLALAPKFLVWCHAQNCFLSLVQNQKVHRARGIASDGTCRIAAYHELVYYDANHPDPKKQNTYESLYNHEVDPRYFGHLYNMSCVNSIPNSHTKKQFENYVRQITR